MAKIFVDTNILVYSMDKHDAKKREKCRRLLIALNHEHSGVISAQVMQEFFVAATKKLNVDPLRVKSIIHLLKNFEVVTVFPELIDNAIDIHIQYRISFWDALIISAAEHAQCQFLWTEDLPHDQIVRGVKIINPMR